MTHPQRNEWIPFLFGEADQETTKRLTEHLRGCPECEAEINGWKRSLQRLDAWQVRRMVPRRDAPRPVLKWAVAAALILGMGFGLGRMPGASSSNTVEKLRAGLKPAITEELRVEMDRVAVSVSNTVARLEARVNEASAVNSKRLLTQFVDVLNTARAEDREAIRVLLQKMEQQHDLDLVLLRKDLETVARVADDQLQQARLRLLQLATSQAVENN